MPVPNSIMAMPTAMSLTCGSLQIEPCIAPSTEPASARGQHAEPGIAGVIGGRVGHHGAEHQRAFEPEIDPSRFLGEALAERDEHERRRDADRAADHGDQDCEDVAAHVRSFPARGLKIEKRP